MRRRKFKPTTAFTHHNTVSLIRCGEPYFSTLTRLINEAQHSIHLQVYIFEEDETGSSIAEALIAAANRGVTVYLLVDGYASKDLTTSFIDKLRSAGIHFRFFQPLLKSEHFYFGRRMHHKVMVADAQFSLVGGINISDRYNDIHNVPAWLDWALLTEGTIAAELYKLCVDLWIKPGKTGERKFFERPMPPHAHDPNLPIRIRRNDWVKRKNQISGSYINMLKKSRSHITIMSSYFIPGQLIRHQLSRAARRGIDISIIVTGVSDVKLAKNAERYMYRWLLKRNIKLYEYNRTVLHGKLATSDDKFVTVGSYNVNDISAYASIELNLDVENAAFAKSVQQQLEKIIADDCVQVTQESYITKYNIFHRFIQYISYITTRMLFHLFTFYFKQQ
jgi:cardiolipin synthase A/B